jgi:hypothetical protein
MGGKGGGSKSVTIGYKYFMGLHMAICMGPVDSLNKIYAGERVIRGSALTSSNRIYISAENVFGGEEKEGGIAGNVDVMFGENTQGANDYLQSKLGTNIPGFRGVLSVVCRQIYIAAMNPYPKPWWFEVTRIPQSTWQSSYAEIGTGSANGAHIIREAIIDTTWGMGYPFSKIDEVAFTAAAETLHTEGIGLSVALHAQGQVEEFVQMILRHINGVLYQDQITGLFTLKLIRDDYTPANLPLFDDSNILSLDSFQRPLYGEMVNEVVIVFRPQGAPEDDAVVFQNLASIQAQGAVISQKLDYPAIDSRASAILIGERELKQHSTPLAAGSMTVNREGWSVKPGDAIRFSWPEYGIVEMVLRINKIDYGNIGDGKIVLFFSEDIFGLPSVSYVEPQNPIWDDPLTDPIATNASDVDIKEVSYFDLATYFPSAPDLVLDNVEATDTFLMFMVSLAQTAAAASGFEVWTKLATASDPAYVATTSGGFTPTGYLESAIGYTDTTDIELSSDTDFDVFLDDLDSLYAYIDDEVVALDSITAPTDVALGKISIRRGCLDTVPAEHVAGSRVYFAHREAAYDPTEYQETTEIDCKVLQITGTGVYDLASATAIRTDALVARHYRPYPPARVIFTGPTENPWYPTVLYNGSGATAINWVDRNRLQQTTIDLLDWFDSGITVEPGTTYTLRYFGEFAIPLAPASADKITTGITVKNQEWTTELTDAARGSFAPSRVDQDLEMTFSDGSIGGSLSDETTAQNVTNVTFSNMIATFADGYCDIGDWAMDGTNWSIKLTFNPDDTGDDYQLLIGKFGVTGTGGTDHYALYWRRTDYYLYSTHQSSSPSIINGAYCHPGLDHTIVLSRDGTGNARPFLNGVQMANTLGNPASWAGRDWALGGAWQPNDPTRYRLFSGTMKDLRVWQDVAVALTDMFTEDNQVNRVFRVRLTSVRDAVDSYQSFDYVVPKRIGWGLFFDQDWNGRES